MCICTIISRLTKKFNEREANLVASDLNKHLAAIRSVTAKSKSFARNVHYEVKERNTRPAKILSIEIPDTTPQKRILERFRDNPKAFWQPPVDDAHAQLGRRLACVTIYLLSKLDDRSAAPSGIAMFIQKPITDTERYAGKRYIDIARQLGGIGAVFCLPLEIPYSTSVSFPYVLPGLTSSQIREISYQDGSRCISSSHS